MKFRVGQEPLELLDSLHSSTTDDALDGNPARTMEPPHGSHPARRDDWQALATTTPVEHVEISNLRRRASLKLCGARTPAGGDLVQDLTELQRLRSLAGGERAAIAVSLRESGCGSFSGRTEWWHQEWLFALAHGRPLATTDSHRAPQRDPATHAICSSQLMDEASGDCVDEGAEHVICGVQTVDLAADGRQRCRQLL